MRRTNDCVVVQLQQNAWQLGVPGYEAPVEAVEAPVEAVRVEDILELATEEQLATEVHHKGIEHRPSMSLRNRPCGPVACETSRKKIRKSKAFQKNSCLCAFTVGLVL